MSGGQIDFFGAPDVGGTRHELDAYDTPPWPTHALCHHLGPRLSGPAWEPCAGAGAIVDVLREQPRLNYVRATDIAPRRDDIETLDFMTACDVFGGWIISNPPYVTQAGLRASDIVRHAIVRTQPTRVFMLLRLAFAEPCEDRTDLLGVLGLREVLGPNLVHPPTDIVVLPRVNYIGAPSGNNQTSIWVGWDYSEGWRRDLAEMGMITMRTYPAEIRNPNFDWSRL